MSRAQKRMRRQAKIKRAEAWQATEHGPPLTPAAHHPGPGPRPPGALPDSGVNALTGRVQHAGRGDEKCRVRCVGAGAEAAGSVRPDHRVRCVEQTRTGCSIYVVYNCYSPYIKLVSFVAVVRQ